LAGVQARVIELAALVEEKSAGYGDSEPNAKGRIDIGILMSSDAEHRLGPSSDWSMTDAGVAMLARWPSWLVACLVRSASIEPARRRGESLGHTRRSGDRFAVAPTE
jgi:hypothetical protein